MRHKTLFISKVSYITGENIAIFKVEQDLASVIVGRRLTLDGKGFIGDLYKFNKTDIIFLEDIKTKLSYIDRKLTIRLVSAGLTIDPNIKTVHGETYSLTGDKIRHAVSEIKRGFTLDQELRDIYIEYIKCVNRVSD